MAPTIGVTLAVLALTFAVNSAADAAAKSRGRHHRHAGHAARVPQTPYAQWPYVEAREPFSFYPENIEGGVPGNLPFNNQLRKFSDPLNANGGGGG